MWIILLMTAVVVGASIDGSNVAPAEPMEDDDALPEEANDDVQPVLPVSEDEAEPVVQDRDEETPDQDTPAESDERQLFSVASQETVMGSDRDDVFVLEPDPLEDRPFAYSLAVSGAVVDGGDGDDLLLLHENNTLFSFGGGSVSGGAGDDDILISGDSVMIDGGAGNDTIETPNGARLWNATVQGGDGNDVIDVNWQNGDGFASLNGGAGDDLIDIRDSVNINTIAYGDEGNDTIRVGPDLHFQGTGYTTGGNGGAGDDLLLQDADLRFGLTEDAGRTSSMMMIGGEGADTFQLETTTSNGIFLAYEGAPDTIVREWMRISDFEVGTDMIVFDLSSTNTFYRAEFAEMSEDFVAGETLVSVTLEAVNFPDQELIIEVSTTGLDWDDVAFIGASPTLIAPVTV